MSKINQPVTPETLTGLNWNSARIVFGALAQEFGPLVSAAAFDRWCRTHYPSSVSNSKSWHGIDSIRAFFGGFENGNELMRRLVVHENARRKGKRASMSAYTQPAQPKNSRALSRQLKRLERELTQLRKRIA